MTDEIERLRAETDKAIEEAEGIAVAHGWRGCEGYPLAAERAASDAEIARLRDVLAAIASPLTTEDFGNGWAAGLARAAIKEAP